MLFVLTLKNNYKLLRILEKKIPNQKNSQKYIVVVVGIIPEGNISLDFYCVAKKYKNC